MNCIPNFLYDIYSIFEGTLNKCCLWIGINEEKKPIKKEKLD